MTRQATGWLLLALAVVGAGVVAALAWTHGRADPLLVVIAVGGVVVTAGVVVGDLRRRRRLESRDAGRAEGGVPG